MSALRTQKVNKVNLWVTQKPEGKYFARVGGIVSVTEVFVPDFPALRGKAEHFRRAHIKDYIGWSVLYEIGGILMDLDVFCLKDVSDLLGDKEVVATPYKIAGVTFFPFNNAVVVARPKSVVIKEALDDTVRLLEGSDINWGDTGPTAFSCAIQRHYDLVAFAKYGTFGELLEDFAQTPEAFKEDGVLPAEARVVHLYASASRDVFYSIDEEFVANSDMLIASLIKQVLVREEWGAKSGQVIL